MKRSDALGLMKAAGYHGDKATWTTLLVEQRVARAKAEEAFRLGAKAKVAGVPCHCRECAEAEPAGESRLPVKGEDSAPDAEEIQVQSPSAACEECNGTGEVDCDQFQCVADECNGKTPCNTCNQSGDL